MGIKDWAQKSQDSLRRTVAMLPGMGEEPVKPARDERHYYLVPVPEGFIVTERHRLPKGQPVLNDLPKVRVFHVQSHAALGELESRMNLPTPANPTEGLSQRLLALGHALDTNAKSLNHTLVVAGGLVCLLNPVAGAGLLAKALAPDLGGQVTKMGVEALAGAVRMGGEGWQALWGSRDQDEAEVLVDPVLTYIAAHLVPDGTTHALDDEAACLGAWWTDTERCTTVEVVLQALHATQLPLSPWLVYAATRLPKTQSAA